MAQFLGAADKESNGGRQLPGHDGVEPGDAGYGVSDRQVGVVGQHRLVYPLQLRSGIDAQLLGQHRAGLAVDIQRLGATPTAVQGQHQLGPHPLPQRMFGGQRDQVGDQFPVPAQSQREVDALFLGGHPLLDQPGNHLAVQHLAGNVRQRVPMPQPQRLIQQLRGRLRLAGRHLGPRGPQQGAEPVHVDRVGVRLQVIPGRRRHQRTRLVVHREGAAQPQHVVLQRVPGTGWGSVTPQARDQPVDRHRLVGRERQHREQHPLLGGRHRHQHIAVPDLQRPQQTEAPSVPQDWFPSTSWPPRAVQAWTPQHPRTRRHKNRVGRRPRLVPACCRAQLLTTPACGTSCPSSTDCFPYLRPGRGQRSRYGPRPTPARPRGDHAPPC